MRRKHLKLVAKTLIFIDVIARNLLKSPVIYGAAVKAAHKFPRITAKANRLFVAYQRAAAWEAPRTLERPGFQKKRTIKKYKAKT